MNPLSSHDISELYDAQTTLGALNYNYGHGTFHQEWYEGADLLAVAYSAINQLIHIIEKDGERANAADNAGLRAV